MIRLTNTMKTTLGAAALFFSLTATAEAQTKATPATPAKPASSATSLKSTDKTVNLKAKTNGTVKAAKPVQDRTGEGAAKVTAEMKSQLNLNDTQYTKVLEINRTYLVKAKDANGSSNVGQEKAKRVKAIADERENKLKSVLTEDQFKKYASGRAENMKKLKEYAGGN